MLPLFPDHIRIGLGASYAVLARVDGAQVVEWHMQTQAVPSTDAPWQPALNAISDWLAEFKPRRLRVGVTLSSELAPLHLLPWRDDITQAERQALLAADHFRRIYGDAAMHWKINVQPTGYGQPWVAAAIDQRLLQALPEHFQGKAPTSLKPLALSLFNSVRTKLTAPSGWMLAPEPMRTTVIHMRNQQWALLKTLPDAGKEPLNDRLLREAQLAGLTDIPGTVYSPAQAGSGITLLDHGWRSGAYVATDSPLHLLGGRA